MSTNVTNSIDVSLDTTDITLETTKDVVVPAAHEITIGEASSVVEGHKKEYSIVGDSLYASVNTDEAPEWLTSIIDNVIANGLSTSLSDLVEARNSIQTALDQLDVAENNYTQAVNIIANIDQVIATEVETLNATVAGNKAEVIDLIATKATPTEASAIAVQQIEASITDPSGAIKTSVIDHFDSVIANQDSTFSQSIDALESTFESQQSDLEASANAISGLQTYVGVTSDNVPDGTGILESIAVLQKQTDGLVETYVDTHELLTYVNNDDVTPESMRFDQYPYALWVPMEGSSDPVDTTRIAYHDTTPQSYPIPEHTVYKNIVANTYWEYHPTTAGGWEQITEDEYNTRLETVRAAHVGDSYIRYEFVLGVKQYVEAYKFIKTAVDTTAPYLTDSEGYGWVVVSDSAAESAYVAALNAYDLADGKRRVFTNTPFIPYDEGDLWVDSSVTPQIVKVSTVTNTLGFNSEDWVQADQQAEDFINNTYAPDSAQIHRQLDGKIEYYFFDTYSDISGSTGTATSESNALTLFAEQWGTQEARDAANGNVIYFKDTQLAYWYSASTNSWQAIGDTSVYKALQAAEGKVSQFYAWGGSSIPADFTYVDNDGTTQSVPADNFVYWLKTDNQLYYKVNTNWVLVPTSINNSGTWLAPGDSAIVYDPTLRDVTTYTFNGTSWQQVGPTGIVSKSKFFVDLENEVIGDNGFVATSLSNLESSSIAYADAVSAGVENKFAYDSVVKLNGNYYKAGFGLTAEGVATQTGDGSVNNAYDSEFWINANKFKFTNDDKTGAAAPFTIDASGLYPEVTFNGKVTFGSSQTGTVDEAIYAAISTIPLGDKNINITDNLIPTISFVVDTDNAGYQLIGNVTKITTSGVDTFAEAQASLDTNGEVYSPYSDELQIPYYYRFAIHGSNNFSQFGIYEVDSNDNVNTQNITYQLEPGVVLNNSTWYIVEGIVNPYGGNSTDYDGVIRLGNSTKIGTVRNLALSSNPALFVLGWVAGGIPIKISRMKLAPITADTVAINSALNYVDGQIDNIDVSGDILDAKNDLAAKFGYTDYSDLVAASTAGNTIVNGGYINTGLIDAKAISAGQINATNLSSLSVDAGTITAGKLQDDPNNPTFIIDLDNKFIYIA